MKNNFSLLLLIPSLVVFSGCDKDTKDEAKTINKTVLKANYLDVKHNYVLKNSATPSIGSPKLLILPIYFSDSDQFIPAAKKSTVRDDISKVFFGTQTDVGWNSVNSYYKELSKGKCDIKGTVLDWVSVGESYNAFSQEIYTTTGKMITVAETAIDNYFTASGEDRKSYDLDSDGFLDGVVIIYAAPDYKSADESLKQNLWAYTNWTTNEKDVNSPTMSNFMWASYDFMYSPSLANTRIGNTYGRGDTRYSTLDTHIFIHEMGHMFGLQDYYDYSYTAKPAGGFTMQDYNVGSHDPYSTMALGWCDPFVPTESTTIKIDKFQKNHEVILLTNQWNQFDSPFDEYLLLEYYSNDGLNAFDNAHAYIPGGEQEEYPSGTSTSGIRLWHVDARLLYSKSTNFVATNYTSNPKIADNMVYEMMSNTYWSSFGKGYVSVLGQQYADYNILQLLRNDPIENYAPNVLLNEDSLFYKGDSFTMNKFATQFKKSGKLNRGDSLGWKFDVISLGDKAEIKLTKI